MNEVQFTRTQQAAQTPFSNVGNGFFADDVQEAIEEAKNTAQEQRFSLTLIHNSSLTNNQRMGYSEQLPLTPIVLAKNSILKEITYSNSSSIADAIFNIYIRPVPLSTNVPGVTATLLQTWTLTNALSSNLIGLSHAFSAGNEFLITYNDNGQAPSDTALVCFFLIY